MTQQKRGKLRAYPSSGTDEDLTVEGEPPLRDEAVDFHSEGTDPDTDREITARSRHEFARPEDDETRPEGIRSRPDDTAPMIPRPNLEEPPLPKPQPAPPSGGVPARARPSQPERASPSGGIIVARPEKDSKPPRRTSTDSKGRFGSIRVIKSGGRTPPPTKRTSDYDRGDLKVSVPPKSRPSHKLALVLVFVALVAVATTAVFLLVASR